MSILIGQKLVENAKIEKVKCDFLDDFQPLCMNVSYYCKIRSAQTIEIQLFVELYIVPVRGNSLETLWKILICDIF